MSLQLREVNYLFENNSHQKATSIQMNNIAIVKVGQRPGRMII